LLTTYIEIAALSGNRKPQSMAQVFHLRHLDLLILTTVEDMDSIDLVFCALPLTNQPRRDR
jgi:hypothetical protein